MDELFKAITSVGFPTVVSIYLLVRFETKIVMLTENVSNLQNTIENISHVNFKE